MNIKIQLVVYGDSKQLKLQAIGVDSYGFSNHSFRSGGVTAAENLNVPACLFKVHGSLTFFVALECKLAPLEALIYT